MKPNEDVSDYFFKPCDSAVFWRSHAEELVVPQICRLFSSYAPLCINPVLKIQNIALFSRLKAEDPMVP